MSYLTTLRPYDGKDCSGPVHLQLNLSMKCLLATEALNFWQDTGMLPFPLAALWNIKAFCKNTPVDMRRSKAKARPRKVKAEHFPYILRRELPQADLLLRSPRATLLLRPCSRFHL